jgi:hypothetical protein
MNTNQIEKQKMTVSEIIINNKSYKDVDILTEVISNIVEKHGDTAYKTFVQAPGYPKTRLIIPKLPKGKKL